MKATRLISATAFAAIGLFATQAAMAYQAGDIYVRGGYAKSDVKSDNGEIANQDINVSDEQGIAYGLGYLFTDKFGVELNGTEAVEHDMAGGHFDRTPVNLMANYYPLGGTDSRVQPYAGVGLNYTHFSNESVSGMDLDHSYGAAGQVGVDLALTDHFMIGAFANYADVDSDVDMHGHGAGKVELDPLTVGGGLTYRF
ncbi:OmpW/AlkL family protein [Halomonas caseinilytica]|uniref:OmpW/AlkL family protein n=1 Tax=Halomonas caseinilytica TaxID=438744 RepID=UPI0007E54138|nr:OmpW family outer membrane protein [Halomonas caseinilytica]SEN62959.1 outer membrane protein [Halomonas caseinilytica]